MADELLMADRKLKLNIEVPFSSERAVEVVHEVLRVDKEPLRSQVSKSLRCEKNILHVCFDAPTSQQLRIGVNGFFENLMLVCETLMTFDPLLTSKCTYN